MFSPGIKRSKGSHIRSLDCTYASTPCHVRSTPTQTKVAIFIFRTVRSGWLQHVGLSARENSHSLTKKDHTWSPDQNLCSAPHRLFPLHVIMTLIVLLYFRSVCQHMKVNKMWYLWVWEEIPELKWSNRLHNRNFSMIGENGAKSEYWLILLW